MKDTQGLNRCIIRPNYDSEQLPSGDFAIYRYWTNKKGQTKTTCIVKSIGKADVNRVLQELISDACKHFEKRMYDLYDNVWAYRKYEVIPRSVLDAAHHIDNLKDICNAYDVNRKITAYYSQALTTWCNTKYVMEKHAYEALYEIYEKAISQYGTVSREKADFSHTDSAEYDAMAKEYNSRFFTLQRVCAIIGNIRLNERMVGYYLA
jgi:preprotein translocase subunit SecA